MATLRFKRGASFLFAGPVKVNGVVQDMTGWTIRAQLRTYSESGTYGQTIGTLIQDLPSAWLNAAQAVLQIGNNVINTVTWPLGLSVLDVELTSPTGAKTISESQIILIVERVTQ